MLRNPLFLFVGQFILVYGLLIAPWPGWSGLYSGYFQNLGTAAFSRDEGARIVFFSPYHEQHGFSSLDARMTLSNRNLADATGHAPVKMLDLDTRSMGWIPTAFTAALILATPLPGRRRAWALLGGMLLIHLFILFTLQAWIWDQSPSLSLATLSPFWKSVVDELDYALVTQLGASFSIPLAIWILVTFRRADADRFRRLLDFGPPRPGRPAHAHRKV